MSIRSVFTMKLWPSDESIVVLYDSDTAMSITNDTENVVPHVLLHWPQCHTIIYRDTDGRYDELMFKGDKFIGFHLLNCVKVEDAVAKTQSNKKRARSLSKHVKTEER